MTTLKRSSRINDLGYMPQLDALRAFAVLGVIVEHYLPEKVYGSLLTSWRTAFPLEWGSGVSLFFVMSGFLITGILLRCKDLIIFKKQSLSYTIKIFYIRRFLRILPIYYLTVFFTAIFFKKARNDFFWYFTYTTNIMIFEQKSWDSYASHFWSLAMEEQFYLIWPLIIFLIPKKHLIKVVLTVILIAPSFRFVGWYFFRLSTIQIGVFPFSSLDTLGVGALLALCIYCKEPYYDKVKKNICRFGLYICLPLLISFTIISFAFRGTVLLNVIIKPTLLAFFFSWLVNGAALGFKGLIGKVLDLKQLQYIGKISYGVYTYHYFMTPIFGKITGHLNLSHPIPVALEFALKLIATLIISSLSWRYIEKPINSFKMYFKYEYLNAE